MFIKVKGGDKKEAFGPLWSYHFFSFFLRSFYTTTKHAVKEADWSFSTNDQLRPASVGLTLLLADKVP